MNAPRQGFLFLQGLASPLFTRLGDHLRALGHAVHRVNFCAADAALWAGRPAWNFRGTLDELPPFLDATFGTHAITDVILFGDQRPVHRAAIAAARSRGARVHVFEEGYVRPDFITVERGGTNAASMLPRDPRWYLDVAAALPPVNDVRPMRVPLVTRARQDMAYRLCNALNPLAFPRYRTHRPFAAPIEYAGWARRFAQMPLHRRRDDDTIVRLLQRKAPYFLLPLQLNGDAQIVHHSSFDTIGDVIDAVLRSFAGHAPAGSEIVIKNHPLDTGLRAYRRQIGRLTRELDLGARVHYLESGHLPTLLAQALGTVIVNSTVGLSALSQGCPTKTLGRPIYDLPGLTARAGLDAFWREREPPDRTLFDAFRRTVIHATQVNGDFFTDDGVALAVAGCDRMLGASSPLEQLLRRHGQPAVTSP
jgi:capsular polysaccharide export protein